MKLLKYTLMSILLIGSTGTFTSCKKIRAKTRTVRTAVLARMAPVYALVVMKVKNAKLRSGANS
ncbi:MAG: hypothetical protein IPH21_02335 [Flavobacteriales bacterium]|nr:hypothetical protein [Flavobacteriales bacterium]